MVPAPRPMTPMLRGRGFGLLQQNRRAEANAGVGGVVGGWDVAEAGVKDLGAVLDGSVSRVRMGTLTTGASVCVTRRVP